MPGLAEEKDGKQISRTTRVVMRWGGDMGQVVSLKARGEKLSSDPTGQVVAVNG